MVTDRKAQNGPERACRGSGVDRVFGFPLESGLEGGNTVAEFSEPEATTATASLHCNEHWPEGPEGGIAMEITLEAVLAKLETVIRWDAVLEVRG